MTKTRSSTNSLQKLSFQQPNKTSESWSLLVRAVIDHHKVHRIGRQDSNYTLAHALLSFYDLGADTSTMNNMYHILAADLEPTSQGHTYINADNWKEHLGKAELYRDFIDFFDREIALRGVEAAFDLYFPYLLDGCIGSHALGITHIAFGMEHSLPTVVSEGMSHICTTYLDVSDVLSVHSTTDVDYIEVLDMIRCDQRFDGRLSSFFVSNVKLLLNSRRDLLKTYMKCMPSSENSASATHGDMEELILLATQLIRPPVKVSFNSPPSSPTRSDSTSGSKSNNYLLGGFSLSSALAVDRIIPFIHSAEQIKKLVNFQRLLTTCTYLIQGRPPLQYACPKPTRTWEDCNDVVLRSNNMQAAIILRDLRIASKRYTIDSTRYLHVASMLSDAIVARSQCHRKSMSC